MKLTSISCNNLGPVVQSVVSLTSSIRVISLTVLADLIHSILIFFAEKMWVAFATHIFFFSIKFQHTRVSLDVNFNESLTNDVVSFEQLGPGFWHKQNKLIRLKGNVYTSRGGNSIRFGFVSHLREGYSKRKKNAPKRANNWRLE